MQLFDGASAKQQALNGLVLEAPGDGQLAQLAAQSLGQLAQLTHPVRLTPAFLRLQTLLQPAKTLQLHTLLVNLILICVPPDTFEPYNDPILFIIFASYSFTH